MPDKKWDELSLSEKASNLNQRLQHFIDHYNSEATVRNQRYETLSERVRKLEGALTRMESQIHELMRPQKP